MEKKTGKIVRFENVYALMRYFNVYLNELRGVIDFDGDKPEVNDVIEYIHQYRDCDGIVIKII